MLASNDRMEVHGTNDNTSRDSAASMSDPAMSPRYAKTTDFQLARVGKKAILRQNFGFLSMLSLACSVMGTWEGIILLFGSGFANGGYLGSVIGLLIVWLGTLCSTATMAEMASMAPTAGGQYHWVAMLAPRSSKKFLSYLAAWFTVINWQSSVAGGGFATASIIQGMASFSHPDSYNPQQWQVPLIYWAATIFAVFFNTIAGRMLPQVENSILVVHVLGFFATMIPLLIYGSKTDPSVVFGTWNNEGNWSSQGVSFLVGLVGAAYAFTGADSAAHMCEEVPNAAVIVPQAMVYGVMMNGCMGFAILLTLLFVLGDPEAVFNTDLAFPSFQVYLNAIGNTAGVTAMNCIILFIVISAIITFIATTSRLMWALSRDKGVPGWRTFIKIEPRTQLPIWSVILTTIVAFVLSTIAFGSSLAFNDVVSLGVSASYATYILGNSLLLWRRVAGHIEPYSPDSSELVNSMANDRLTWGPWKMSEPLGIAVNVIGILYMLIVFVFSFFPAAILPDAADMNWSCLMFGVVMLFSMAYYLIGRREYKGPTIDIDRSHEETIYVDTHIAKVEF